MSESGKENASPFAPFRHRLFRGMWVAGLTANLGSQIQTVGAAWLMTSISLSTEEVALVQAANSLPLMLFSLLTGTLADMFSRRSIMLTAQTSMLCASLVLAVLAYLNMLTPWLLLGFVFFIASGTALHFPSWQASTSDMVPRADLGPAVTLNSIALNATRSVGPALGGLIVGAAGAVGAFIANCVCYLPLIVMLGRWQPQLKDNPLPRERLGAALTSGLRYVGMSPRITRVIFRAFVYGFAAVATFALLPIVARDLLHGGPRLYGLLLGSFGLGAITGGYLSTEIRRRIRTETIVSCACLAAAAGLAVLGTSRTVWLSVPALFFAGASWVLVLSLFNVVVQIHTPRWVMGRALALYQTFAFGGMSAGSWAWGLVAERYGPTTALAIAAGAMLACAAMGLVWRLADQEQLDLDPLDLFRHPTLAVPVEPNSGPVVISIEYRIRPEDVPAFLAIMQERRRIRRRDGARRWTLMRDLENSEVWIESYKTPTWLEYVRHHQRTTKADGDVGERIRALHLGPEPPLVRRKLVRPTARFSAPPNDSTQM